MCWQLFQIVTIFLEGNTVRVIKLCTIFDPTNDFYKFKKIVEMQKDLAIRSSIAFSSSHEKKLQVI